MKSFMTRWKIDPLYPVGWSCFKYSPVHNCRKFSHVLGHCEEGRLTVSFIRIELDDSTSSTPLVHVEEAIYIINNTHIIDKQLQFDAPQFNRLCSFPYHDIEEDNYIPSIDSFHDRRVTVGSSGQRWGHIHRGYCCVLQAEFCDCHGKVSTILPLQEQGGTLVERAIAKRAQNLREKMARRPSTALPVVSS